MSDPKKQQRAREELDLDAETVKDLDPDAEGADEVRGGALEPYVYLPGQKQGKITDGCPPPAAP